MPDRNDIVEVAIEGKLLADELAEFANERFRSSAEPKNDELIATLVGLSARNGLRALLALSGEGVDDQVGILGRALTERALDLQYLRTATHGRDGPLADHYSRRFPRGQRMQYRHESNCHLLATFFQATATQWSRASRPSLR